jgi:hypothetical protein
VDSLRGVSVALTVDPNLRATTGRQHFRHEHVGAVVAAASVRPHGPVHVFTAAAGSGRGETTARVAVGAVCRYPFLDKRLEFAFKRLVDKPLEPGAVRPDELGDSLVDRACARYRVYELSRRRSDSPRTYKRGARNDPARSSRLLSSWGTVHLRVEGRRAPCSGVRIGPRLAVSGPLSASLHISARVYDVGPDDDPNAAACRQASTKDQIAALT